VGTLLLPPARVVLREVASSILAVICRCAAIGFQCFNSLRGNMSQTSTQPGKLDIVGLFQAEANSLVDAVSRGQLLHKTKNIRDSGAPLERKLRAVLADRLPAQVELKHGYLFDVESKCTPQIDAMLLAASDNHPIMSAESEGIYAPFTSARAFLEIKSSFGDLTKQLNQTKAIISRIRSMREEMKKRQSQVLADRKIPRVISILFFVNSMDAKVSDFTAWLESNQLTDFPTYTVLLDKGRILARRNRANQLFEFDESAGIDFEDYRNAGDLCLCRPNKMDQYAPGRTLAWIYFMLLHHASKTADPGNLIRVFTKDAVERFAIVPVKPLHELAVWE
jgi:uncharacterized protein DUF6602